MTGGIAIAAIVLFIGTAGAVLPNVLRAWSGGASAPDVALTNALILNIALILLGWQRYRAMSAELAERRTSEAEARRLAEIDHLTGALNRRSFSTALADTVQTAVAAGRATAVLVVDLDNFKQINDLHGHLAGDAVLRATASRIERLLPADAVLARLGGDEFACAIPFHPQVPDRLDHLANQIVEQVAIPVMFEGLKLDVTLSIGIVSSDHLHTAQPLESEAASLVHKADIAMYHAKKRGKNRFYWFEPSMEYELRFRNELESGIRRGISRGEFVPYYEQQIDLESGALTGFEMLARWDSPELGLVGPDIFIPIAEEIGAIGDLSESLMARAFEDAKGWHSDLTLSVNISPVQMRDPWFAQKILKLLVAHSFPPHRLDIEITESCLHENVAMVRSMITSLRNQGVKVSLDDFGTGYSSLMQLRELPFDRLKIDRSFVSELRDQRAGGKLVDAIVAMSEGLEMPVTAEGVEDAEILDALRKMGKLKGQGYHYGRPEPADKVLERLRSNGQLVEDEEAAKVVRPEFGGEGGVRTG